MGAIRALIAKKRLIDEKSRFFLSKQNNLTKKTAKHLIFRPNYNIINMLCYAGS